MSRFTLAAAAFIAAAGAASAETMIKDVRVIANLNAFDNAGAAEVWKDVETDLEEALVSRIVDQIDDKGARLQVEMDTVALADSLEQAAGTGTAELKGRVKVIYPDNTPNIVYMLTVKGGPRQVPEGVEAPVVAGMEYYDMLIGAFADNVVDKLE